MPDLPQLLDQIDRLDQEATPGAWKSHFGGNPHDEWLSVEPKTGARTICTVTDDHRPNAEFIALARDAMPKLAEAVYQVLALLDAEENRPSNRFAVMYDGKQFPATVPVSEVRQAIHDAMEADNA